MRASCATHISCHRVHMVRQVLELHYFCRKKSCEMHTNFPCSAGVRNFCLAAQETLRSDLAYGPSDLVGKVAQALGHLINGFLQIKKFTGSVNLDRLGQVSARYGLSYVGDRAH